MSNRFKIREDAHDAFEARRKKHLSRIELMGLEAILVAFIEEYEQETYGVVCSKNVADYTRYNDDSVDILDGAFDTYIFDVYAIDSIWMTDTDIPILSCYKLESDEYDDPFEVVRFTDWMTECEHVLFRLD